MNLNLIQSLSALSGLLTTGTALIVIIIGSFYVVKSGLGKTVSKSQQDAIAALQATILALQSDVAIVKGKLDDEIKKNARLDHTIDTICAALKIRGMVITIQGEMIHVEDRNGKTTTTRIHDKEE